MAAELVTEPDVYMSSMLGYNWNCERFLRQHLAKHYCPVKFFPYHMYTVRQANDTYSWHKGNYSHQLGHYIKYDHEYNSTINLTSHIQNQNDWNELINNNNPSKCFNCPLIFDDQFVIYDQVIDNYRLSPIGEPINSYIALDGKNEDGELYSSSSHMGLFERSHVTHVSIIKNPDNSFSLRLKDTGELLAIIDNMLSKVLDHEVANNRHIITFKIRNRFHTVLNNRAWHRE